VGLVVLASKTQDCQRGNSVLIQIADLQEMLNHMRETLDAGLADLQSQLSQGGFPVAPAAAMNPPVQPSYAAIPMDANVASLLSQEAQMVQQPVANVPTQGVDDTQAAGVEQPQPAPSKASRIGHIIGVLGAAALEDLANQ
jgi:hypothetical protein